MTPIRFYGQHGEDCLLWSFFGQRSTGFYVDVGAFDGRYVSNTYAFEQQGWRGICIEPHPASFALLRQMRTAVCINAACVASDETASVTLYTEKLGFLSGLDADRTEDVRRRYQKRGLVFDQFQAVEVPALTLNAALQTHLPPHTALDFISLDVEGTELEVLRGLDLHRYRPRVLVIEANTAQDRETLSAYLATFGYSFARRREVNTFYVRDADDIDRLRALRIDCSIEPTPHPFGEHLTPAQHVTGYTVRVPSEIPPAATPEPSPGIRRLARRIRRILKRSSHA